LRAPLFAGVPVLDYFRSIKFQGAMIALD